MKAIVTLKTINVWVETKDMLIVFYGIYGVIMAEWWGGGVQGQIVNQRYYIQVLITLKERVGMDQ